MIYSREAKLYTFSGFHVAIHAHRVRPRIWTIYEKLETYCIVNCTHAKITSTWRRKTTDSGIHELGRAIDVVPVHPLRFHVCERIRDLINWEFEYDEHRKTCLWHNAGSGYHWHIQIKDEYTEVDTSEAVVDNSVGKEN